MPTWTELHGRARQAYAEAAPVVVVPAVDLRELLLDLPNHPNLEAVRAVTIEFAEGKAVMLSMPTDEAMASGATAPGAKPTTTVPALHQRHVRNLLSSAPVTAYTDDLEPGQPPPRMAEGPPIIARSRPTEVSEGSSMPLGAGWLEGVTYKPKADPLDRLIILPGDA